MTTTTDKTAKSGKSLTRRSMLKGAAVASAGTAAAATLASPAIAQSYPEVRWRMPMFVPKSVDNLWAEANAFADAVKAGTDGKMQIQPFGVGEIVPGGPAVLNAVEAGTVECGFTLSYYSFGKDPSYGVGTVLPFMANTRMQLSWFLRGGGGDLFNEFLKTKGVRGVPIGNSTAQMGGWYRKEIKSLEDLKGLRMRIPGLGGAVVAKLGVVPQQIAVTDIYPSLERGTIDAAEWAGPYDDEKLGFVKVAPYYYAPGFWEPNAMILFYSNLEKWNALPKHYQAVIDACAVACHTNIVARYDATNSAALKRLIQAGAKLGFFSTDILDAAYKASFEIYEEIAKTNATFAKLYGHQKKFLEDNELNMRVGENTYDSYVYARRARG